MKCAPKKEKDYYLEKKGKFYIKIIQQHFAWQRGCGAYSVSGSKIDIVKKYIKNQDKHHNRKSFTDEYEDWKKEYGIFDD